LLAAEQEGLPASVSQAVLARVARLPEPTRALLNLLAVVPTRTETGLLDAVCPDWPEAAAAAEERGVLTVHGAAVAFRHELALGPGPGFESGPATVTRSAAGYFVLGSSAGLT
jgi:hypothetical protein